MARGDRSNTRRGRRIVGWTIAIFAVVQLAAGLLLDYRWPLVRFPSAGNVSKRLELCRPDGPDIVFLGSSRFGNSIRPDVVQPRLRARTGDQRVEVTNGWVPTGDACTAEYLLQGCLQRGRRPALVVLEVMPENLVPANVWVAMRIHRQVDWPAVPEVLPDAVTSGQLVRLVSARTVPLYVHRREIWRNLWSWASGDPVPGTEVVYPPPEVELPEPTWEASDFRGPGLEHLPNVVRFLEKTTHNYRIHGEAAAALERLLRQSRQIGTEYLLVAHPVWSRHRAHYPPEVNEAFQEHMRRLCATYGCRFVDCRAGLPDELLMDTHHASPPGAWRFSQQFTDEVLAPYWSERQRRLHNAPDNLSVGTDSPASPPPPAVGTGVQPAAIRTQRSSQSAAPPEEPLPQPGTAG